MRWRRVETREGRDGPGPARRRRATGPGCPTWWLKRVGTLGVASLIGTFVVVPVAFFLLPVPAGADAVTLCLPGFGPLQQFAADLSADLQELVVVHERTHARQCREMGAAAWMARYGTTRGRLELEAEAFCAEVDLLAGRGEDREALMEAREEVLYDGYRNDGALSRDEVRAIMRQACSSDDPDGTSGHPTVRRVAAAQPGAR